MKNIRWGIIGCGDVTEVKSGPGFQKAIGSELVAVMRRNGNLAKEYAVRHSVPVWYDDATALIRDPNVDAVYVATPPSTHKEYTIAALNAGKPVLVEKPMGLNYLECQEMNAVSLQNKTPLFTAYYRRALPRFLKIKSLLDGSAVGAIKNISIRFCRPALEVDIARKENWRTAPSVAGDGYFFDLGCHNIDLIQFLVGPIQSAIGSASNHLKLYPSNDNFTASLSFENGIQGTGLWNFSSDFDIDETEIRGTEGRIFFSTFTNTPITIQTNAGSETLVVEHPHHVHQPLIQSIVDELRGTGKCESTGLTGMQTNWVMDKILGKI
jgi:predicted dehydrogenase